MDKKSGKIELNGQSMKIPISSSELSANPHNALTNPDAAYL